MAWDRKTLEECTEYITDGDHQPAPKSDDGVLFIKIKDIKDSRVDFKEALHVPLVYYEGIQRNRKPVLGDTLYTVVGSYGLSAYVNFDIPFCFERNIALLHPKKGVDSRFLFYSVNTPDFFKQAENAANGAAQKLIPLSRLKQLKIQVPPFATQKKIADILSAYDDLIENNQKQIKLLEEAAQRLYKQWFIDLRFPDHETTKIVDGLPEGWRNVTLGDVYGKIESGSRPKGGIDSSIRDGIVSVGAENVIGLGQYNYSSEKLVSHEFYENSKRGKVEDRDILVYKDGAYIGRTSLFQDEFPRKVMMVNEHVFLLNAKNPLYQYYLFFTLNRQEYFDKMQKLNKNSAQPGINQDALKSLVIIWPSDEIVMKFDNFVAPMVKKIFALAKQNYELSQSRDRLLPKLMNGELEM
jgi:type I restriction enzyme S subunit